MRRHTEIAGIALLGTLATGCLEDAVGTQPVPAPEVLASSVDAGLHNVLSAAVSATIVNADSVRVHYRIAGSTLPYNDSSSAVRVVENSAEVPLLGLHPGVLYLLRVVAFGKGGVDLGEKMEFVTGPLPPDLPQFAASGSDPSPGLVAFASGPYLLVIDNSGRVVWYRRFEHGAGLNFMAQPNGHYVARPPTPDPTDIEQWLELDPLGNITRTFGCALGLRSRIHDLILEEDGGYWILCDETRTVDLTSHGGMADAQVTGTVVQHISAEGRLLFNWTPFDHFAFTDLPAPERSGREVNWTHGNAIDLDVDGNLLLSFRSLGEITKVDRQSGAVLWRLGGIRNQFLVIDSPSPVFSRQHGVRSTGPGTIVLLDNLGDPRQSRAERYTIDAASRIARLTSAYASTPAVVTQIGGSAQPLDGDRVLVSFGTAGRVEEYDAAGNVVWRIEGNPGYVFRAQRIASLHAPGVGTPR